MAEPTRESDGRGNAPVAAAFVAASILGGANFVAVRFSNAELAPFWGAAARFGCAALVFLVIGLWTRAPFPRGRALVGASLFGLLAFGASYAFAYVGLEEAPAGIASVIFASVPLWTLLLAVVQRQERFRWVGVVGAVVAVGGIAVMFGAPAASGVPVGSFLLLGMSSLTASEANVVVKWFPRTHPVTTNAVAMALGSVVLLALSVVTGEQLAIPRQAETWWAFWYLVLPGSVGLFVLYLYVLKRWTASRTSYAFLLAPGAALPLGAWLQGEPLTASVAFGAVLVVAGVYIGAFRGSEPETVERSWPSAARA